MATKVIRFTASALKRVESDTDFNEFRDPRYPLRLRLHASRETGSWLLVNKRTHKKLGNFPAVNIDDVVKSLSANLLSDKSIPENEYTHFSGVLDWYLERSKTNKQISKKRFATIKWAITKHLLPRIGELELSSNKIAPNLDKCFFQPMQYEYSVSTVKNLWVVFKQALRAAAQVSIIAPTPVSALEFQNFIKVSKGSREGRPGLRFYQVKKIFEIAPSASVTSRALVSIMLIHGTRIGETRCSRWRDICFDTRVWTLPLEITKTDTELKLPLTDFSIELFKSYKFWQESKGYKGEFIFPRRGSRGPITEKKADLLINEISQGDWTSHQLRKYARSTWIELKIDYLIGELLLNHTLGKVPSAYIKTEAEERKLDALIVYHGWLSEVFPRINGFIMCATPVLPPENSKLSKPN